MFEIVVFISEIAVVLVFTFFSISVLAVSSGPIRLEITVSFSSISASSSCFNAALHSADGSIELSSTVWITVSPFLNTREPLPFMTEYSTMRFARLFIVMGSPIDSVPSLNTKFPVVLSYSTFKFFKLSIPEIAVFNSLTFVSTSVFV